MRARDFIYETTAAGAASDSSGGKRERLHKDQKSVISSFTSYPNSGAHYYDMYRYGIHLARNPDNNEEFNRSGPTSNEMVTIAYTDQEKEMHDRSSKAMGFKRDVISQQGSKEPEDTYSVSPINQWNKK